MSIRVLPAFVAAVLALVLALVLFVPFVAREFRRRGELRAGTAALGFALLLYLLGLAAYVLIPLPPLAPGFCAAFGDLHPQLHPLAGLADVRRPREWADLSRLLADDAVRQFAFNVLLFVPLGMFSRHLFGRGVLATTLIGASVSLFVELTQLTGIWFIYPCPYRLFDVDDLIANTAGTVIGTASAPLLRLLPGQRTGIRAELPRPVTGPRRLVGMCCDLLLLCWLGSVLLPAANLLTALSGAAPGPRQQALLEAVALWLVPSVLVLLVTAVGGGSSPGQHAVLLRAVRPGHRCPGPGQVLRRWLAGTGGFALLQAAVHVAGWSPLGAPLAAAWCAVHALGLPRSGGSRGISGRLAALHVIDARLRGGQEDGSRPVRPVRGDPDDVN